MKSSITKLATVVAAAALLAMPISVAAQTPPPSQPPATAQPPASPPPASPTGQAPQPTGTTGQTPQTTAPAGQPDERVARQHLTAARNTLSEVTQLPQASQLTGETRTQVSQLISNFNELITSQSDWRGAYAKVAANLTALLGPYVDTPDPSGAPGTAVGTSGTPAASLDPAIREKLMQFRKELAEFEKAAGGTAVSVQSPSTADTVPTATPPEVRPTDPTAPPATTPPTATPPSTTPPSTTPPTTTPPSTTTPPATAAPTTTPETGAQMAGNAEILRHIAAIEAMLKVEDDSGGVTLTKVQLEQLRTHLASLRAAIEKK